MIYRERLGPARWATMRLIQERKTSVAVFLCDIDFDGNIERLWAEEGSLRWDDIPLVTGLPLPASVLSADLDSDGTPELIVATQADASVTWHRRNRSQGPQHAWFDRGGQLTNRLRRPTALAAADLTADGMPDVVAGGYDGQILCWKNEGDAQFAKDFLLDDAFVGLSALEIADVDLDGLPDVLAGSVEKFVWYRNQGDGHFDSAAVLESFEGATWLRPFLSNVFVYTTGNLGIVHRIAAPVDLFRQPALDPNAKALAVLDEHERIRVWELPSERLICTLPTEGPRVRDIIYAPDGHYLLAAVGDDLRIWDAADYRLLHNLQEHDSTIYRIAVSADSKLVATVSDDMSVRLWNLPAGQHQRALAGHQSFPVAVAFSRDGRRLASVSNDGTIHIWDTTSGQELIVLTDLAAVQGNGIEEIHDICFRDDRSILAVVEDGQGQGYRAEWRAK
jgi:WD40 repeat protein